MNDTMRQWIDEQKIGDWVKGSEPEEIVQRVERLLMDIRLAKDELKYQHEIIMKFEKEAEARRIEKLRSKIMHHNSRAYNLLLPNDLTVKEWDYALKYFDNSCAICQEPFWNVQGQLDHWIPLSYQGDYNPGSTALNVVPVCSSCNSSKGQKVAFDWLIWKFGEGHAEYLREKIFNYFSAVAKRKYNG